MLNQKSAEVIVGRNEPSPFKVKMEVSQKTEGLNVGIGEVITSVYHKSNESRKHIRELLLPALDDGIKETCRRAEPSDATSKNYHPQGSKV